MQKKYLTIYHDLLNKIHLKSWQETEMLPSENELSVTYTTSRETIRKALNLLAQNGYIQKVRGKGSVIINRDKFSFPVSGIVSFKEITEKLDFSSKTYVENLGRLESGNPYQDILNVGKYDQVWHVDRVREISDEKIILDKDYFNESYIPLPSKEICEHSIYEYIETELELVIGFAQKEIIVEEPTAEDRELLDLEGFSNIVVIKSLVYLEDTRLFQYGESRHRPDKFRFVDFARRVKNGTPL
ncbi:trehalose operon repressor [Oceanobacillus sp. 143]|jgi:GntR family trehalose operon transcriptional repressor|uniref:Trehalose operon repressor n=1 Tax=Oceanobacillus zhaokaii TaxID=2052660 RepID=A0A345PDC9_9BACI|nr:trehalose operon repressor [Oceanobacillus zhaokaii]AXI08009.1 trehalose operon repressor [Oceanobacillus zhaokaii]QGS68028.1 trehalose operon repressor [Oceanobacillus sp. 143]